MVEEGGEVKALGQCSEKELGKKCLKGILQLLFVRKNFKYI